MVSVGVLLHALILVFEIVILRVWQPLERLLKRWAFKSLHARNGHLLVDERLCWAACPGPRAC